MSVAAVLRRLTMRRAATPAELPPVHAFDPGLDCLEFNLSAVVLPALAGPLGRARAVIYLEVTEAAGENAMFVSPETARLMLAMIEFGLSASWFGAAWVAVDTIHFSRAECRAIQRVLYGALDQVAEMGRC